MWVCLQMWSKLLCMDPKPLSSRTLTFMSSWFPKKLSFSFDASDNNSTFLFTSSRTTILRTKLEFLSLHPHHGCTIPGFDTIFSGQRHQQAEIGFELGSSVYKARIEEQPRTQMEVSDVQIQATCWERVRYRYVDLSTFPEWTTLVHMFSTKFLNRPCNVVSFCMADRHMCDHSLMKWNPIPPKKWTHAKPG